MIKSITISSLTQCAKDNRLSGSVVMVLEHVESGDTTRAQFLCRIENAADLAHDDHLTTLAREALRQARRLPDCAYLSENDAFVAQNITLVT
ncbi:hypothetical protein [Aliiroseovarius crassostreae]|uniref:hypothetical protein n=1 Tax=Aliiroseovarius crassostreae TaxID=154981 RepID=UPI003C7CBAC9